MVKWRVVCNGDNHEVIADNAHFLGDSYKADRLLVFKTKGKVMAAFAADRWTRVQRLPDTGEDKG